MGKIKKQELSAIVVYWSKESAWKSRWTGSILAYATSTFRLVLDWKKRIMDNKKGKACNNKSLGIVVNLGRVLEVKLPRSNPAWATSSFRVFLDC